MPKGATMPPMTREMAKAMGRTLPNVYWMEDVYDVYPHLLPTNTQARRLEKEPKNTEKTYYEELRLKHVPRFLFRAWHRDSGGGSLICTNSTSEIIPAAFFDGSAHVDFYDMDKTDMIKMAEAHYKKKSSPLTGFSSWAASIHLVVHYAKLLVNHGYEDVHVACIDTGDLDSVLVWHVPHLYPKGGNEEYLAYGKISGKGYQAVSLSQLESDGIDKVFPMPLGHSMSCPCAMQHFGSIHRSKVWGSFSVAMTPDTLPRIAAISELFGPLSGPIALALLTMAPRFSGTPPRSLLIEVAEGLLQLSSPLTALSEPWLEDGKVNTTMRENFQDVRHWIDLCRGLLEMRSQLVSEGQAFGLYLVGTGHHF